MPNNAIIFDLIGSKDTSIGPTGMTPSGLHYAYLLSDLMSSNPNDQFGVFAVVLPFVTDVHMIGIPRKELGQFQSSPLLRKMEAVELEGDYDSFFSLYAAADEQIDVRTLLNPEAMEYTIDFCASFTWEIFRDTFYFVNQGPLPDMKIIDDFVKQLTPRDTIPTGIELAQKAQATEKLAALDSNLLCPVCKIALRRGRRWLACSSGHGYLLTAHELLQTRMHMDDYQRSVKQMLGARPAVITPVTVVEHGPLLCPNDNQELKKQPYQETQAFLYVCNTCIYRWIDGGDLDAILGPYRNDGDDKPDEDEEIV